MQKLALDLWLEKYGESHQNPINQVIHKICVPVIFFSLLGLLWAIPVGPLNMALLVSLILLPFYIRLGQRALLVILPQLLLSLLLLAYWEQWFLQRQLNLDVEQFFSADPGGLEYWAPWKICLGLFVIAWIGQFVGHKIEGKKPSFFDDLKFLLIGPLWVFIPRNKPDNT